MVELFNQAPCNSSSSGRDEGVDECKRGKSIGFKVGPGVEAEPAHPQKRGTDHRHGHRVRRCRFLAVTDALADHDAAHEARDASIDVHHSAASEVKCTHAP